MYILSRYVNVLIYRGEKMYAETKCVNEKSMLEKGKEKIYQTLGRDKQMIKAEK